MKGSRVSRTAGWIVGAAIALCACAPTGLPSLSGYAEADLVYVAAAGAGTVQTLAVKRGDRVARGQPLFTLDTDAEALNLDAADARQAKSASQLANLRKGKRPLELAAIDQQLAQARAALTASAGALQRQQALVSQGFVAPQQLTELQAARDRDEARVRELQALRASAAEAARADEIAAAAADARGSSADVALARWREAQRQRRAPVDAVVFDLLTRPGEWVNAGTPVVSLLPPSALKVRFFVPEPLLPQARIGRDLMLACDGCPAGLTARIRWVSPQAEFTPPVIYSNGSRAKLVFMVEAEPAEPGALKPGQPLDVRFADTAAP
jgi:HlyD family secretion protein